MNLIVFIVLCLIWGSTWIAIKIGLSDTGPFTTAAIRFIISSLVLTLIVFFRGERYPATIRGICKLCVPGIYMYGISYSLVYLAEQYIDSSLTAVLFGSFPFFVALISWYRYRSEQLSKLAMIGMVGGFTGVVVISYNSINLSNDIFLGTLMVIAAAFSAAWGVVLQKRKFSDVSITVAVNVQMITGTIILIIGMLIFEDITLVKLSLATIGSIIYLALFGTVVTFLGYYWLLKRMPIVTLSLVALITPLIAILIGVPIAGETFGMTTIIGTILILSGVYLVARKSEK